MRIQSWSRESDHAIQPATRELCSNLCNKSWRGRTPQTLPVLANLLVSVGGDRRVVYRVPISKSQMVARTEVQSASLAKSRSRRASCSSICRALPDGVTRSTVKPRSAIECDVECRAHAFHAGDVAGSEFPVIENIETGRAGSACREATLKRSMDRTAFAMAHQDVRYYLNGMLVDRAKTRCAAWLPTAIGSAPVETNAAARLSARRQIIIPRKGVLELQGLLESGDGLVNLGWQPPRAFAA